MIKKIFRLTIVLIAFLLVTLLSFFSFRNKIFQDLLMRAFSKIMIKIFNIKITYNGTNVFPKNTIIVCNHMSYLDIIILLNYFKGRFIVKQEIKKYPIPGWSIAMLGNIFIERGNKKSYEKINNAVKDTTLIIFPEGYTSFGETINEFKSGAFVAALKNKAFILPVVIKYNKRKAAWVGDDSLFPHLWNTSDLNVEVTVSAGKLIDSKDFNATWTIKGYTREKMLKLHDDIVVRRY